MSILTKAQIIEKNGKPIFAVIPYEDYLALLPEENNETIPHEVTGLVIKKKMNLLKAWRIHLKMSQKDVAQKAGISQAALSQMEKIDNEHRTATLVKLAKAMGLSVEQLKD
jgi:DNA-binding XRE family transcriptional regulator